MVPTERGSERVILQCPRCGYKQEIPTTQLQGYAIAARSPEEERTITTSKVSEARRRPFRSLEEWEQEREEYREVLLEQLQEELEGAEE